MHTIRLDRYSRTLLTLLTVLLAILVVELWSHRPAMIPAAAAQVPDAAAQRQHLLVEQRRTNELLERIAKLLDERLPRERVPSRAAGRKE